MAFPDKPSTHLLGSNGPVHAVAYSASPGNYILTGSADRSIRLYNPTPSSAESQGDRQGRLIQTYAGHGYEVLSLAVARDNESFASGGGDRGVFLWDVRRAVTTRRFEAHGHAGRVNCVKFGGEGDSLVVSGGFDTTVRVWDVRSGGGGARPVQVLDEARDAVTSLAVRDAEVVAGSVDGRVRSYDVRMGRVTTDVVGASVVSLAMTRDGGALLVGSLDSRLRLMDARSGECLRAYGDAEWSCRDLRVQSVLGGGDKYVVAGDEMAADGNGGNDGAGEDSDGRVWAWDLLSGKVVARVRVPWGPEEKMRRKPVMSRDGSNKVRRNVISCVAWREDGWGDQFCVGGTSGVVTVFT